MLTKGYMTHVPLIYIRDKSSGHERLVGTNCHDQLIIDEKTKAIRYHNLQNSCGTPDTYELVEPVLRECESKLIELRKQKDNYQMLVRKILDFLMEDKESVSLKYAG